MIEADLLLCGSRHVHLPVLNFQVGTVIKPKQNILIVCPVGQETKAITRLSRVGYEDVVGVLTDEPDACLPVESFTRLNWVRCRSTVD